MTDRFHLSFKDNLYGDQVWHICDRDKVFEDVMCPNLFLDGARDHQDTSMDEEVGWFFSALNQLDKANKKEVKTLTNRLLQKEKEMTDTKELTIKSKVSNVKKTAKRVKDSIKNGVQQAATDEVSEMLLVIFEELAGGHTPDFFATPIGRELAKGFVAAAVMTAVDHLDTGIPTDVVLKCAELQVQTAAMRVIQPHMSQLSRAAELLVRGHANESEKAV